MSPGILIYVRLCIDHYAGEFSSLLLSMAIRFFLACLRLFANFEFDVLGTSQGFRIQAEHFVCICVIFLIGMLHCWLLGF